MPETRVEDLPYLAERQNRIAGELARLHKREFSLPLNREDVLQAIMDKDSAGDGSGAGCPGIEAFYLIQLHNELENKNSQPARPGDWNFYERWKAEFLTAVGSSAISFYEADLLPRMRRWLVRASVKLEEAVDLAMFAGGREAEGKLEAQAYEIRRSSVTVASFESNDRTFLHVHLRDRRYFKGGHHAEAHVFAAQPALEDLFTRAQKLAVKDASGISGLEWRIPYL